MATSAFELIGRILLEGGDRVRRELDNVRDSTDGAGNKFSFLSTAMKGAGLAIGAAITGLGALGAATVKMGIEYNAMKEQSQVAWTTLLGTQGEAVTMMKNIGAFAASTPFETADVDMMAKYMHNAGLEGDQLFKELTKVSDVASAFAIPAADAKELTRQMSQVRQAGIAYTEDLNVLADRGVPIYGAISKQLGITVADVKKMASEGKLSSDIYLKAFDSIAKGAEGASAAQSKTFSGMISTLKDNALILAGTLTEGIFAKAKGFLEGIGTLLTKLNEGFAAGGFRGALEAVFPQATADMIIGSINALGAALKWIIDNWSLVAAGIGGIVGGLVAFEILTAISAGIAAFNVLMAAMRAGTLLATLAQWGLNTALLANPLTWVAVGIGVLIAAVILLVTHWDTVRTFFVQLWADITAIFNTSLTAITTFLSSIWDQITAVTQTVWNAIVAFLTPLLNGLKTFFEVIFFALFFVAYTIFEKIWTYIEPTVTKIVGYITEKFSWVRDRIKEIWGWISNEIMWIWGVITNNVAAEMDKNTSYIYAGFKWVWDKITEIWNGIKNAISWAFTNLIAPVISTGINAVKQPFLDLVTPMYTLGKNIIQGLINGLADMWGTLKNKITEMANKGKALFSNIFGVKSPSTFTTYIGRMLGEGMSTGLDKSTSGVLDSAKSMATGAMGALAGSFSPSMNLAGAMGGGGSMAGLGGAGSSYSVEIPLIVNGREVARAIAPNIDQELERQRQVRARGSNG